MAIRLRSRIAQALSSLTITVITTLIGKAVDRFSGSTLSELWRTFGTELWFLWLGLVLGGLWWLGWEALKLLHEYRALKQWVGMDAIQYNDIIREWLKHYGDDSWPYIHKRSLDDRVVTLLEWWSETQMEHKVRLLLMKIRAEEARK